MQNASDIIDLVSGSVLGQYTTPLPAPTKKERRKWQRVKLVSSAFPSEALASHTACSRAMGMPFPSYLKFMCSLISQSLAMATF